MKTQKNKDAFVIFRDELLQIAETDPILELAKKLHAQGVDEITLLAWTKQLKYKIPEPILIDISNKFRDVKHCS
jgi:hypothetical protein